jgi:hypothetical protein
VGRLDWSDPGGAGLFSAILDFEIIDGGGSSGNLFQNLRILNDGPAALTIDIFHYTDIDAEGTWNRDWATWMADPGGPALSVTDGNPASGGETAPMIGYNADAYQVTDYRGLLSGLTDNGVTDLDGSGLPFSNGDITVGFQWSVTIGVGESDYFRSQVASNTVLLPQNATVVPEPAVVVLLGLGLMALAAPDRSRPC